MSGTAMRWRSVGCVLLTASLAACAVGPDFERPAPPDAKGYTAQPLAAKTAAAEGLAGNPQNFVTGMDIPAQGWMLFQSPKLNRLVEQALTANPTVDSAKAALRQSRELYSAQWTSFLPTVQGDFSASRNKNPNGSISSPTSTPGPYYSLYTTQLSLSYAPDVFGATRRAVEAAEAQVESNHFQLEAVYLTLSSNVVVTAIQEAGLRGQIAATERLLELQHALTEKTKGQRALGTASELDLLSQQAAEAVTAQTLPPLQKQLAQTRDALSALLGRLPSEEPEETFRLDELTLPGEVPVSLPSKLVEQRPDIRQAEANLHAATAEVGVALADMLPQLSLTANTGTSGLNLGQLFTPGFGSWGVGSSMTQTIFDAGALLHKRRAADAAMEQAAAQYRSTVILAFQNVADSLRALQSDADALKAGVEADRATKRTFDLTTRQYGLGTVSQVAVLSAEQAYQQAELALVQAQANRYSDTAGLFQALGGGWWNRALETLNEQPGPAGR
jgi:NodT family efflux transporter outer membrane factor (OMF) lipoprotein